MKKTAIYLNSFIDTCKLKGVDPCNLLMFKLAQVVPDLQGAVPSASKATSGFSKTLNPQRFGESILQMKQNQIDSVLDTKKKYNFNTDNKNTNTGK